MSELKNNTVFLAKSLYAKSVSELDFTELHDVVARAVTAEISEMWKNSELKNARKRRAYYFSAEFLVGRAVFNNLLCSGLQDDMRDIISSLGADLSRLEEIGDAALGNGGLGRLAACFLDSAATLSLPLDGYGIRYKFGLFRQYFQNGFQKETADDWASHGDPWSIRREDESQRVEFSDFTVRAVPYDMPIIGYKSGHISTLRLWQAEPLEPFNFELFNAQHYDDALSAKNRAEDISRVLYPNDSSHTGKLLRLRQQYFFSSASLKDILRRYKKERGGIDGFEDYTTIQLNDTHPVISIPELIRLLMEEGVDFRKAFLIAKKVFNYTNHTIMQEALEKWDISLVEKISFEIAEIIRRINSQLKTELTKVKSADEKHLLIVQNGTVHMAYLACYCSEFINGVAKIHTEILKDDVLGEWYKLYPEKFQNKTNGITQRRWLALCNPGLSSLITELCGTDDWIRDLNLLENLKKYSSDERVLSRFADVKKENKKRLSDYIMRRDFESFSPEWIVDVQIKRLHEYKRQLLNALAILEICFEIKEGALKNFYPTVFIFGAKAAPGYVRAKAIIKLINEISAFIESDDKLREILKVIFVSDYNVSYAEKIVAAADVSEQISTAGTEASGTGNMKLMLNGAVTLGTYDGANIEIAEAAGEENNYIFGARHEDIEKIRDSYNPMEYFEKDRKIKRCLSALIDGTLSDGGTGMFRELYDSLLKGAEWHSPDHYFLLLDFEDFLETKLKLNSDYKNKSEFYKKCWNNMCAAGRFSSDRTIAEYAKDIWKIE